MKNGCSDRLTRQGRDLTFDEAMDLYAGQIDEELATYAGDAPEDKQALELSAALMREAHRIACDFYLQASGDEERASSAMQACPSELVQLIGEALESGDYAVLAI